MACVKLVAGVGHSIKSCVAYAVMQKIAGTPTLGAGGVVSPSALIHGGQEGQEFPFILKSFHLSYLLKGHFQDVVDSLVQENFSGVKPPDPKLS